MQWYRDGAHNGLSPRVRGNHVAIGGGRTGIGSIPACAGEPGCRRTTKTPTTVYPRVCGGTQCQPALRWAGYGLSPRVRGNRHSSKEMPRYRRSIPACAGEPYSRRAGDNTVAVYPRVCGGTHTYIRELKSSQGLSPRVRGNRYNKVPSQEAIGSIPACAGEPHGVPIVAEGMRVYPRVCGGTPLPSSHRRGG